MSRLFWVRHGPTHAKTLVGWSDLPADLTDTARLKRLSAHLPADALVVSSDLIRASATADAILGSRTRLPHDPALREIHFGDWELQYYATIPDQSHLRQFWDQPGDITAPNGESWNSVSARVSAAIARLHASHPNRDIIAVAHFGVILTQVQRALGTDAYTTLSHKIDNLSVTELHTTETGWQAKQINHCP